MNRKKTLIATIAISIGRQTYAYANDCNIVAQETAQGTIQTFNQSLTIYHKALPPEWFQRAIANLNAYCCKENKIQCDENKKNTLPKNFPQSDYLFDHIVDVMMRRLEGIPGPFVYDIEPDPMAKKRAETIKTIEETTNGLPASVIQQAYTGYRTIDKKRTKNHENTLKNFNTIEPNILSLADKYENVCTIAKELYENIQVDNKTKIILWNNMETNSYLKKCQNMVRERIQRKSAYTQILMVQKSTQFLDEATKSYTNKYFVENKLMNLRGLITKFTDVFKTIVQQAAASQKCNK